MHMNLVELNWKRQWLGRRAWRRSWRRLFLNRFYARRHSNAYMLQAWDLCKRRKDCRIEFKARVPSILLVRTSLVLYMR